MISKIVCIAIQYIIDVVPRRETGRETDIQYVGQVDRHTRDRQTHTGKQVGRQVGRQAGRWADKHEAR